MAFSPFLAFPFERRTQFFCLPEVYKDEHCLICNALLYVLDLMLSLFINFMTRLLSSKYLSCQENLSHLIRRQKQQNLVNEFKEIS